MVDMKDDLTKIVGVENISDDPNTLEAYSQDQSFRRPLKPWFVVRPQNADEIQAIVQWANQTHTSLIPVSSGPPHFRGDTVPSIPGEIIVDLSRMRKIIRIDRRNRMTIIEPGVTYTQLQPELAKEGLRVSTPLLPRHNKSVMAGFLRGNLFWFPGTTGPCSNHCDALR